MHLTFNEWLSSKTNEDIEWLIKEFKTLQQAYYNYLKTNQ